MTTGAETSEIIFYNLYNALITFCRLYKTAIAPPLNFTILQRRVVGKPHEEAADTVPSIQQRSEHIQHGDALLVVGEHRRDHLLGAKELHQFVALRVLGVRDELHSGTVSQCTGVLPVETAAIRPSRGYECQAMLDGDQIRRSISRGSGRLEQTVEVLDVCCDVLEVWLEEGMQGTSETHLADMNMGECGIAYEQPLLNPLDTTLYLPHDEQLVVVHVDRQPQLIAHREDDLLLTDSVGG